MASSIPEFQASQSSSHVILAVDTSTCDGSCSPRAVVDDGTTFGVACKHFHLPLVFPKGAIIDGRASLDDYGDGPIRLRRKETSLIVELEKQQQNQMLDDLDKMKASVFPLLEEDEEGQREERQSGLDMLQRGVDAVKSDGLTTRTEAKPVNQLKLPTPAIISRMVKTKVHECFAESQRASNDHEKRRAAAIDEENRHWDEGMYLDNFVDEEGEIKYLISATLPENDSDQSAPPATSLTSDVADSSSRDCLLLLLDLLLAHAYDYRTTLAEPTVESAWTIAVLSRSLVASHFPSSTNGDTVESVLIASIRRQLSYPLYRNWNLSIKIANDVLYRVKKAPFEPILSSIDELFRQAEDEAMSVYSSDIITPLVQHSTRLSQSGMINGLTKELSTAISKLTKTQVGGSEWGIESLEEAAQEAIREGRGGHV